MMRPVNYDAMSVRGLRLYCLEHPYDQEARQAYLNRLNDRPPNAITIPDNPDFDAQVQASIKRRMGTHQSHYRSAL
jgi:polyphosphate kinase 2 (PPK2 family)